MNLHHYACVGAVALWCVLATSTSQSKSLLAESDSSSEKDSTLEWPKSLNAPASAPNILLIMLDDVGFGDVSTFGGPAQTPVLDALAAQGLKYNRFHTTGLCSPTRAALLSGRNHHRMGFGTVGEVEHPGYDGVWKKSTVSVAEVLRRNGYSTAAFGKWHNTPFREISPNGPFDHWPTGLGFEYYYGNMHGASSQWEPDLWRNTLQLEPPGKASDGYHYTTDIVDEAIDWLHTQRSNALEKPYFIYLATGAAHAPHHVPKAWIEKYRGQFNQGWDTLREEILVIPADAKLAPRPEKLPLWDDLTAEQKRIAARQMEVYAAFISHTDHEIGRLIEAVKEAPGGDNTLVLYIVGDNGASAEALDGGGISLSGPIERIDDLGGPRYVNHYAAGWAIAGSAPFQGAKGDPSHFGGSRDPLVVWWPARIKDHGALRTQFTHVNDVAPTLYDVVGIQMPKVVDGVKQLPLDGVSFADSFYDAAAPSRHRVQYFEAWGNRAIYSDGWVAAAPHQISWEASKHGYADPLDPAQSYLADAWALYHVDEDFSEARDLAKRCPGKLRELKSLFEEQARKNDVYPLISNNMYGAMPPPVTRAQYTYYPGRPIPAFNRPPPLVGSFIIEARVSIPQQGVEGVLVCAGSRYGGFALYVKDDHLIYEFDLNGERQALISRESLPRGEATLIFEFVRASDDQAPSKKSGVNTGHARLYVNGSSVGEGNAAVPVTWWGSFTVGQAFGAHVSDAFTLPFKFTGTLKNVVVRPL